MWNGASIKVAGVASGTYQYRITSGRGYTEMNVIKQLKERPDETV